VDFTGSSPAVAGSINAVPAIALSAVGYVIRCLVRDSVPSNQGVLLPVKVIIPADSVLDPGSPHAVAGGNVETSMRIVDVVYGALAQAAPNLIPADSQGTMNNLTFGGIHPSHNRPFAYYETMGGGSGAGPQSVGAHGVHCHMSNTLNTPVEALELSLPVRIRRYAIRRGSGGDGLFRGGDGLERELEFLSSAQVTMLSDRRRMPPHGLAGGKAGACGENTLYNRENPQGFRLSGKATLPVLPGDVLSVKTPGGGGWGARAKQ
jgi:N-methylhydantoinase B